MHNILDNPRFAECYQQLGAVTLNPRRHTAASAYLHSEQVAARARTLARQNGCTADEVTMLENLGRAHDVGKVTGTARPEKSLDVLASCGDFPDQFLALVKRHDTSLPWWNSLQRGQPPSDKAWRRLARDVDMRLLCIFMVADRVDAPAAWRRNAPTMWFIDEARQRSLIGQLSLDLAGEPSEVSAGAALVRSEAEPQVLLIRVRRDMYELPKGGIEWDELPSDAAIRELEEEAAVAADFAVTGELGAIDYEVANRSPETGCHVKRVQYFGVAASSVTELPLPKATRERLWINRSQVGEISLVNEDLRPIVEAALAQHATRGSR